LWGRPSNLKPRGPLAALRFTDQEDLQNHMKRDLFVGVDMGGTDIKRP
jgi:hypothetical protein